MLAKCHLDIWATQLQRYIRASIYVYTVEPLNNGHGGDEHSVDYSEVVPSLEVEMYGQLMAGGKQFVHCREVVLLSECPLSEVLLYTVEPPFKDTSELR